MKKLRNSRPPTGQFGSASAGYKFVYYCLFEWYDQQSEHGDPEWEAEWYAWVFLSYFGTSAVVAIEVLLAFAGWRPLLLYQESIDIPAIVRYAWSFPIMLVINYVVFMRNLAGRSIVTYYQSLPLEQVKSGRFVVGFALHVLFFTSIGLAIFAPPQ